MQPRLRLIEFLAGPLDGKTPPVPDDLDCVVYTDGANLYQYVLDDVVEGPFVREVMRLVTPVPPPRREGQ